MKHSEIYYQADYIPGMFENWWKRFIQNKLSFVALMGLGLFLLIAILAPLIAPHDPLVQYDEVFLPPFWDTDGNARFLLGTDALGRDVLSRLIYGIRLTLELSVTVVVIASTIGVLLGVATTSAHKWVETLILRLMDLFLALPSLLVAIAIVSVLGSGVTNVIYAVTIILIPHFVLITRSAIRIEMEKDYVTAMILDGSNKFRLFYSTILPNIVSALIIQLAVALSTAVLEITALGFLGLGASPPSPELGTILSESHIYIISAPWTVTLPGLAIFFIIFSINLVSDGLMDTRSKEQ